MQKFAALALTTALGLAGMGYAKSADAGVVVGVGVGLPVYAYPPAVGLYGPYYRGWPYYYGPGFARFGYGFRGYGGYGFRGRGFAYGHGRR